LMPLAVATAVLSGCAANPYTGEQQASKAGIGATTGAVLGGVVGGLVSNNSDRAKGIAMGAAAGAALGGGAGDYFDRQEAALRQQLTGTGVQVVRQGDQIQLIMPGDITYETDKDVIRSQFYPVLNSVAEVFRKFDKTIIQVDGHTDSTGAPSYNLQLSQKRARSVSNFLVTNGIDPSRIQERGFGQSRPVADNGTASGRAKNRRVEISVKPI